jgi:antitoxin ParD1/3/4
MISWMATMNISLPDDLKAYVDERVRNGGYGTSSDYFRELIHRDQGGDHLRQLLLEGAASPIEGAVDDAFFERLFERVGRRAAK